MLLFNLFKYVDCGLFLNNNKIPAVALSNYNYTNSAQEFKLKKHSQEYVIWLNQR